MRRGRRLAIDVGDARIGVASCDPDGILATPVETVPGRDVPAARRRIKALVDEYEPIELVVGLPRSLRGGEGPAAKKVRAFAGGLALLVAPVPVRLVDERMTTVTAGQGLRASGVNTKKGRSVIDQAAAVIILQTALESEQRTGLPPGKTSWPLADGGTVTFPRCARIRTADAQRGRRP
ncbi:Holliday junction resolvase RuvX [Streptomyces sp. CLI2509]|uniref:Holliday junction resolvase RuvX n=1 Tax=Streptomyces sp. CLI2509 TaxID=1984801 RepID=UPI000BACA55C|nr:Holliday junction resolvase RuvX [Streptomyces sp. CLI2509]ASY35909.1 Holliday junction resolvase RuvX [Streptomyces sp. CLI2509]